VLAWADGLDPEAVAITAMNEAEILHGLARLPDGRRKQNLQQSWNALTADVFTGRIWPFTSEAAHWYAQLLRRRERLGRSMATAAAGKGSTRADAAAMAASRRGAHWRLPFMSLSSCRASERDPVALVKPASVGCSGFCAAISGSP
jgi:predicted nucleic acid-binding protein